MSNEKNIFALINDGLKELWKKKWKFIFIVLYTIVAFFLWNISCAIYELFTFNELPELIYKIVSIFYYSIIAIVLLLLLFQVVISIGKVANRKLKNRCETGFRRCGLKTSTNEVPTLRNVYKDYEKEHGIIYEFDNVQIPMEVWEKNISSLQLILKGIVYNMDIGIGTDIARIPILPYEYVTPYYIDVRDNALSSMDNCLIVGQTGSR